MARLKIIKSTAGLLLLALAAFLFAGCGTTPQPHFDGDAGGAAVLSDNFNIGDLVKVTYSGIEVPPLPHEERVKDDGTITLTYIGSVKAAGKSPGQLQREIRDKYIQGGYYTASLNITVSGQERFVFVGGEVRLPNRYPYTEGMTVLKAIQTAGGFTDFANHKKVYLTRVNGKKITVNADKAQDRPELDLPVYPGDLINVAKKWW